MSAMRDMSRAIRHELEDASLDGTMKGIPEETLIEFTEIVGAMFYDLVGEKERRGLAAPRPSTVVAYEMKVLRARIVAHHELSTLSREAIAESLGGTCQICVRARDSVGLDSTPDPELPLPEHAPGDLPGETPA